MAADETCMSQCRLLVIYLNYDCDASEQEAVVVVLHDPHRYRHFTTLRAQKQDGNRQAPTIYIARSHYVQQAISIITLINEKENTTAVSRRSPVFFTIANIKNDGRHIAQVCHAMPNC